MSSLEKYLAEEKSLLRELSAEFAPEYRDEALRSFVESSLLPEGSFNLLMMADGAQADDVLQNLALVAYDRFVSGYLEQVNAYAAHTIAELTGKDLPSSLVYDMGSEQLEHILSLFKEIGSEDPVLDWFISEGAAILSYIRTRIIIKDVDGLAVLIRQLEYYSVFFISPSEVVESYSYLIDILERIKQDLSELGVLAEAEKSVVVLGEKCFEVDQWIEDAFHLIDWKDSFLKTTVSAIQYATQKCLKKSEEKDASVPPKSQGSLILDFPLEADALQWSRGVIDEIDMGKTEKGRSYGKAGNSSSRAAA